MTALEWMGLAVVVAVMMLAPFLFVEYAVRYRDRDDHDDRDAE